MIVRTRAEVRAYRVLEADIAKWTLWPQWVKEQVYVREAEGIVALLRGSGCVIVEGEGAMSLEDFHNHWETV